ncbi:MAG: radical SAM protein [Bdellovibrionia bacterium]
MSVAYVIEAETKDRKYDGIEPVVFLDRTEKPGMNIPFLLERLKKLGSSRAVFVAEQNVDAHLELAVEIKKWMPSLEIVFDGPLPADTAAAILREGRIDRYMNDVLSLWLDSDRVIRWSGRSEEKPGKQKTLLVLMPAWNNDFAPSGLAHISAALQASGHQVDVLDLNWVFWRLLRGKFKDTAEYESFLLWTKYKRYKEEARPHLEVIFKELKDKISNGQYRYVGFSLFETNLHPSRDAFRLIRRLHPDIKIFCGGPSSDVERPFECNQMIEKNLIDAAVLGEGEVTVVELLKMWSEGGNRAVDGAVVRSAAGAVLKGNTRPLANINQLPFPDFSGFNVYDYDQCMLPVYFSRGCVARCTFCSETEFWVRFRILKPDRVIEMIKRLMQDYGITRFQFTDSLINGSHRHLEQFADQVIEQKIKILFKGYCRLESDLTAPLLAKLAKAGCDALAFGMDSSNQRVTELMRKEVDVTKYGQIIKDTFAAGIKSTCCVIVGFPGETRDEFLETARAIEELGPYIENLNISVPTLKKISANERDMKALGIRPKGLEADKWETVDGSNTPKVRMSRFRLLQYVWSRTRKKPRTLAPSWIYRPA